MHCTLYSESLKEIRHIRTLKCKGRLMVKDVNVNRILHSWECRGARPCDHWMNLQVSLKARAFFGPEQLLTYPARFLSTQLNGPICHRAHSGQWSPSVAAHINALENGSHPSASRFSSLILARNLNPTTVNTKCLFLSRNLFLKLVLF
jgi:hypothetical protein